MESSQRFYGGAASFGLMLAITATLWARGSIGHFIVILIASVVIGLPVLAFGLFATGLRRVWDLRWLMFIQRGAFAVTIVLLIQIASLPAGAWVCAGDVREARRYCDQLIPLIEEQKRVTGRYPVFADELAMKIGPPPHLLRGVPFYTQTHDNNFTLAVRDPGEWRSFGWVYYGDERAWREIPD